MRYQEHYGFVNNVPSAAAASRFCSNPHASSTLRSSAAEDGWPGRFRRHAAQTAARLWRDEELGAVRVMKPHSLLLAGLLVAIICSVALAEEGPRKDAPALADWSVCDLRYGGYGECISELLASQVSAAPRWDISAGPPPLLPEKAETIASAQIESVVKSYVSGSQPLLFSHLRTRLIKSDEMHWFYGISFMQRPAGGGTGGWPVIEVFVTFDGKVGLLKLTSHPKKK